MNVSRIPRPLPPARVRVSAGTVPTLARGVRLSTRGLEAAVLLSPERGVVLNETAAAAIGLFDGRRCVEDVVRLLRDRYADGREVLASDVLELVEELAALALVAVRQPPSSRP